MAVDPRLAELAQRSPNFGFLLAHEAVLVGYGAAAESMAFTDPNTSMIKARQFGEQLVTALVTTLGIRSSRTPSPRCPLARQRQHLPDQRGTLLGLTGDQMHTGKSNEVECAVALLLALRSASASPM